MPNRKAELLSASAIGALLLPPTLAWSGNLSTGWVTISAPQAACIDNAAHTVTAEKLKMTGHGNDSISVTRSLTVGRITCVSASAQKSIAFIAVCDNDWSTASRLRDTIFDDMQKGPG